MAFSGGDVIEVKYNHPARKTFNGKCLVILKSTGISGEIELLAESEGLENASVTIIAN